jgi:hypothetical protein
MASTMDVAKKLVELCRQGKFKDAINATYADNIVSVEAASGGDMPRKMEGIAAVLKKTDWWEQNHTVHSIQVDGPWPHDERFIVHFKIDVTAKSGPMSGKRFPLDEAGLYTIKDGKIVHEEFFYHMG